MFRLDLFSRAILNWSWKMLRFLPPQGLCTCCPLFLEHFLPLLFVTLTLAQLQFSIRHQGLQKDFPGPTGLSGCSSHVPPQSSVLSWAQLLSNCIDFPLSPRAGRDISALVTIISAGPGILPYYVFNIGWMNE